SNRISFQDSTVIQSRGHNNNAVPNPTSKTARTIASHFSFRFMCSPLPAKPIAQAIKNAAVDPSHCLETFPTDVFILIQFDFDHAAPAGPNFAPIPIQSPRFRLVQSRTLDFERRKAQFLFEPIVLIEEFLMAHAWSAQDFHHLVLRHANSDLLPRLFGDPVA